MCFVLRNTMRTIELWKSTFNVLGNQALSPRHQEIREQGRGDDINQYAADKGRVQERL